MVTPLLRGRRRPELYRLATSRPLVPSAAAPGPFSLHAPSLYHQLAGRGGGSVSRHHDGCLSCRLSPGVLPPRLGLGLYDPDDPAWLESHVCPAEGIMRTVCRGLVSQS